MKILLTGSNGFLGKLISLELEKENQIFGLSRNSGNYKVLLEKSVPVFIDHFDLVIHCAGKAHSIPKTEVQKKDFYDVNVLGTQNLLKGLDKSKLPKKFIFISSVSVYGKDTGSYIQENHPLQAIDAYGKSKFEAEKIIINWCEENNIICTILRLPLLVGKEPPGNLGAMIKAIIKGYYFNIGGGKAKKSMVLGKDVASVIIKVASIGGIYNLTDGHHPNFDELSLAISKNKNKKKPINLPMKVAFIIGKVGDLLRGKAPIDSLKIKKMTSDLTFDDTKARTILDWNPQSVIDYINKNKI
ncbi:NAD-dependent epimerase/dehydratase family protein [Flavobacterium piscisymbiosum]|uniref:NAD-dependent epimerase/dehydratase family protein n=1 Tax=Flavobacterium piscisymbiosum TaxID=2893753 RepID=A0ABS8M899_9FLAO|nr:NAD-dependent epimerase/dehydratase family protein [Flavobacterium sp. F-30]MCC9061737.1 NAD-dependent epimerase/dehydratase family protein [Flavobacterium sp. F-30]